MSDSIDKFVLQYTVELKDSIARLEKLQDKVKKTNTEAEKTKKSIKEVAKEVPGVDKGIAVFDKLQGTMKKMPPAAYAAAAAIVAIAAAVKLVSANMKEYEMQRATAQKSGMAVVQVEDFQRRLSKGSGGRVGAENARGAIEAVSAKLRSAQVDPNMNNKDAIGLRMAGVSTRNAQGGMTSSTDAIEQMMEKFKKSTEEVAIGLGTVNGLTIDQSVALRNYALAAGTASSMTQGEAKAKEASAKTMERLSQAGGRMDEALRSARTTLADALIPKLDWMADVVIWLANGIEKGTKMIVSGGAMAIDFFANFWKRVKEAWNNKDNAKSFMATASEVIGETVSDTIKDRDERNAKLTKEQQKQMNETAEKQHQAQVVAERTANLFSNAVMAFANAIDEKEAWAAWAGLIGAASGLRDDSKDTGKASPHPRFGSSPVAGASETPHRSTGVQTPFGELAPSQSGATPWEAPSATPSGRGASGSWGGTSPANGAYDSIIAEAAKKHGVPADLIKKVIKVESNGNAKATSNVGAQGLMQLMPSIQKAYGIKDAYDPASNIDGGARLLAENLKRAGGNTELALRYYHGGLDRKNWGPVNAAYPGKVMGANIGQAKTSKAETVAAAPQATQPQAVSPAPSTGGRFEPPSKSSLYRDDLIRNIENALGVPFGQIKQGAVSKGDVAKTLNTMYNGQLNHINDLKTKLQGIGLPQTEVMKMTRDLATAERNLSGLKQRGSELLAGMADGGQNITFGANSVLISVDGAKEPFKVATETKNQLYTETTKAATNMQQRANSIKY